MSTTAISVRNVSKRFRVPLDRGATLKYRMVHWRSSSRHRDLFALNDLSFDVPYGQFLGIIGHNGSGKSTLLKVLSGIFPPTQGTVQIAGPVSPFLELGVGFNPELNARENVFLNGTILGLSHDEIASRFDEIIEFAGVRDKVEEKLKNFSSGLQVRLAFSVAIRANAGILLMDEVLAVGDAEFQDKCMDIFADYRRSGRTVVLVTHDLSAVDNFCDRAILLDHGSLVADGGAAEVTAIYRRMVAQKIEGDPSLVPVHGRWGTGEVQITDVRLLDAYGKPHRAFTSGQALTVQFDYRVVEPVDEVVCALGVYRAESNVFVAEANSLLSGMALPCPRPGETATVTYSVPTVNLLGGSYQLSVTLHPRHASAAYDHMDRAFDFKVIDESSRLGLVELGGSWSTTAASALRPAAI